jgi:hypothetical protein
MDRKIQEYSLLLVSVVCWVYVASVYGWRAVLWVAQQTVPEPWQSTLLGLGLVVLWFLSVIPAGCGALWGLCVTPKRMRRVRRVTYAVTFEEEEDADGRKWHQPVATTDTQYHVH